MKYLFLIVFCGLGFTLLFVGVKQFFLQRSLISDPRRINVRITRSEVTPHQGNGGLNFNDTFYDTSVKDTYYLSNVVTRLVNGSPFESSEFSPGIQVTNTPTVLDTSRTWDAKQSFSMHWSRDVSASLDPADLDVKIPATGQHFTPSSVSWNPATKTATWSFNTILPDGDYEARLVDNSIQYGNSIINWGGKVQTWFKAGDANRDHPVDFADLLILAQNYGKSGRTFSSGNFDYSSNGKVDFSDLLILAQKYGLGYLSLPGGATASRTRSSANEVLN